MNINDEEEAVMKDTIFYVGGGKGGVGKSMVSMTLVQFLIDKYSDYKTVCLIETDESNPVRPDRVLCKAA